LKCWWRGLAAERLRRVAVLYPHGQSYQDVVATADFLRDLAAHLDGSKVPIIAHSANKWACDILLGGASLEEVVAAPFAWQEGWCYTLTAGWAGPGFDHDSPGP